MPANRGTRLDLLSLAEDVFEGRRSQDNVIDQIAVTTPDDRERRHAVAELQSLILALTGVEAHARATVEAPRLAVHEASPPANLVVAPGSVVARRGRVGPGGALAAGATALAAVVIVAVVAGSLRPAASVGGPSAAPSAAPTSTPTDAGSAAPTSTPLPTAAAGLPDIPSWPLGGPAVAFSSLIAPDKLDVWLWNPLRVRMTERLTIDTWTGATIQRTALISPDGSHIAVREVDSTTNSPVQRVRILTMDGRLVWTAPTLPLVTSMAWSPDGTALAIGSLPVPWTVVQLNTGTAPGVTTYNLDDQDGYALLGFSEDGDTLYGYGTGGEAEFWEKPVSVDRARGTLTHLEAMPGGAAALSLANSTAPIGQFDRAGRVLARAGGAKGDLRWITRTGAEEAPVAVGADAQLTWSGDTSPPLVALSRVPASDPNGLAVRNLDVAGRELPTPVSLPAGSYAAVLAGARNGFALLLLEPATATPSGEFAASESVLVDLATGRVAVGLPPDGAPAPAVFQFAGWISPPG